MLEKKNKKALKVMIIGLGGQTRKDHIPAILRRNDLEIVGLVDKDEALLQEYGEQLNTKTFTDTTDALKTAKPDLAIVSIPHNAYFNVLEVLAGNKIPTLKEKPLAMTHPEAVKIIDMYNSNNTYLQICVQRRFSKLYQTTKDLLAEIGDVYSMYVEYTLNLNAKDMANGWRADKRISGGGAALDMGYHSIDLLTYIFGLPDKIYAQLSHNSLGNNYTIEDTMKAMMTYDNKKVNANIVVTKIFNQKNEKVRIFGTKGSIYVDGRKVMLYDMNSNEIEAHTFNSKNHEVDAQLQYFIDNHNNPELTSAKVNKNLSDQLSNMLIIDAIYKSHDTEQVIKLNQVI